MDDLTLIKSFVSSKNAGYYNIKLAKIVSINAAILYSNLLYLDDKITENRIDGYFYTTYDMIEEYTGLTIYQAREAINKLLKFKLIDKVKKGMPSRNYFKIISNFDNLIKIIEDDKNTVNEIKSSPTNRENPYQQVEKTNLNKWGKSTSTSGESQPEQVEKTYSSNNITNKSSSSNTITSNKSTIKQDTLINIDNKKENKRENKEFEIFVENILEYLNKVAGTRYKSSTQLYRKHIKARLRENYTLDDFKHVIDVKVVEWKDDIKMARYIRPETLFGTKMATYVAQPKVKRINGVIDMDKLEEIEKNEDGMRFTDEEF